MVISAVGAGAVCGGLGLVAGAFMPALGRKIKAVFVKDTQAAKKAVAGVVSSAGKSVDSAASSVAKKL